MLADFARKRELAHAADVRDAAVQTIRDRYSMDELDERAEAINDRAYEARWVLLDMPAPDLAALRWKLDYLADDGDGDWPAWAASAVDQTKADIARLLPEGA